MHRAAALAALALALAGCGRDLSLDASAPPRVDSAQVAGLDPAAAPAPLPVLGGELVVLRGGGFAASASQVEVRVGGAVAEVVEAAPDRLAVKVPALGALGAADLKVATSVGFTTVAGALRYDGPGAPQGFGSSDLSTSVPLSFVAPVQPPGSSGFSDLAVAIGAADSALLVVPAVGVGATTIPLGLVPVSAAARLVSDGAGGGRVEVLALSRGGTAALGTAVLDASASAVTRVAAKPLASALSTAACAVPQVTFTLLGAPVAAWASPLGAQRIAAIDPDGLATPSQYRARGAVRTLPAPLASWAPWKGGAVVAAAGAELYEFDADAATTRVLSVASLGSVTGLLAAACGPVESIYSVAVQTSGGRDALAVAFRAAGGDKVALVGLASAGPDPAFVGSVWAGAAGTIPTAVALVPDPPLAALPGWSVLVGGISTLYRFTPLVGGAACRNLVPDAALALTARSAVLPAVGGLVPAADGTRLLALTGDGDLVTVLPPSLTSAGPVLRLASYGGVSVVRASVGGQEFPVAVAEHASFSSDLSSIDTGSAFLAVSLASEGAAVALGGSGYGRGAVWLDPQGTGTALGGALAYTGDLPATAAGAATGRAGAAAVTGFLPSGCAGEAVHVSGTRPVAGGPDLVLEGPARRGAFGPEGVQRHGPAAPAVYTVKDQSLHAYGPAKAACLAGAGSLDWDPGGAGSCLPDATVSLGVAPLDVTLSAGDRTAAARSLDLLACAATAAFPAACGGDPLCRRAQCPPARALTLVAAGGAPRAVALPARPAAVAADPGGGFLVTLPCAPGALAGGGACFPGEALCARFLTGPGGADGALLLVPEDGAAPSCLAVLPGLAGPLAVTPNGAQAWVSGEAFGAQILSRLALPRGSDGRLDPSRAAERTAADALGTPARATGSSPPGGVAFTPDGSEGIVTVPGMFRIVVQR